MVKILALFLLGLFSFNSIAQTLSDKEKTKISELIEAIKEKNYKALMPFISLPLDRQHPVPDINNESEFIYRYDEIFDDSITQLIVNSDIDKDWSKVGWRGIMFNNGDLWLDEYNWTIKRINVQTSSERKKANTLINYDKSIIHESIKEYQTPVMVLETKKYIIRIDLIEDDNYRYAVWPVFALMHEKPDLIIENGSLEYMGSGGNHQYEFTNGDYKYICRINIISEEDAPPANLIVEKIGKEIVNEPAEIIKN